MSTTENSERVEKSGVLGWAAVGSPVCLSSCASSFSVLGRRFRSWTVVEPENLALRHQLHVLRRHRPGRPRLFTFDRLPWVLLYRSWPRWLEVMVLVKPATIVSWHVRDSVCSGVDAPDPDGEIRDLIRQMNSAARSGLQHAATASRSSSASSSAKRPTDDSLLI